MAAIQIENQQQQHTAIYVRYRYLILLLITLLAGVLRGVNLGKWSFAIDEVFTLQNANQLLNGPFTYRSLVEHPITSSLVLFSTELLGFNEWSARLAPAIIGVLSIPIFYLVIKKVTDIEIAMLTIFMLALSPWHLFWSQSARFYVLLLLFYSLSLLAFYWGLETDSKFLIVLSMVWVALAVSERLLAVLWGPVIIVYLILITVFPFEKPPGLHGKNLAVVFLPGVVIGLIFAWDFVQDPSLWQTLYMTWIGRGPLDVFWEFLKGIDVTIAVLGVFGVIYGWQHKNRFILLLTLNVVVPLGILMVASLFQFTHNRYMFVAVISSFILAANGLRWLLQFFPNKIRWVSILFALVVLLFPIEDIADYHMQKHGWRIDWKSGFEYVTVHAQPGDLVMSNNPDVGAYYFETDIVGLDSEETAVSQINAADQQVWFIIGGSARLHPVIYDWVRENGELVYTIYPKVEIYFYNPHEF